MPPIWNAILAQIKLGSSSPNSKVEIRMIETTTVTIENPSKRISPSVGSKVLSPVACAASKPLPATAGTPIPGKHESPHRTRPGTEVDKLQVIPETLDIQIPGKEVFDPNSTKTSTEFT